MSDGFGARIPIRRRNLTVSFSPSAAAPKALVISGAGEVTTMDGKGVPDVGILDLPARKLVALLVVSVIDVDVQDINDV